MALTPHVRFDELRKALHRCLALARVWSGIVYRSTSVKYATSADLLSGVGSKRNGGRWNPIGSFETVYTSTMPDTAMDEAFAHHRYFGIPIHKAFPRVFVAISAKLSKVLNLTDGKVRQHLRISLNKMFSEDWRREQDLGKESLSQTIGRAAFENGLEALLVRSAASSNGEGLVIFPTNLITTSRLEILNASDLPS
jgi:RES domain-containing protein